jgi:hypothetical protein
MFKSKFHSSKPFEINLYIEQSIEAGALICRFFLWYLCIVSNQLKVFTMQRHECLLAFHGKLIENECEKLFSFSKKKK